MGVPVHSQPSASRVLYIRNIAEKMTEADLVRYCMCFGEIPEVLIYPEKRHGFIQFASAAAAQACLDFYTEHALAPHGPKIEFAFSGRDEITHKRDPALNPPNRILIVTVSQVQYPVTVDVMSSITTPWTEGRGMKRCVVFNRQDAIQALVELWTVEDAILVRDTLDGVNIYPGCNSLRVQFSSMTELHVKANNSKAFDFTLPPEPVQDKPSSKRREARRKESIAASVVGASPDCPPVLVVGNLVSDRCKVEDVAALFAVYGNVTRVQLLWSRGAQGPGVGLVYMQDHLHCAVAQMHLHNVPLHGQHLAVEIAQPGYPLPPEKRKRDDEKIQSRDFKDMPTYNRHKGDKVAKLYPPGPALHVSNMPDNTSGDVVLQTLNAAGAQVRNFKFLDNLNHIAVVLCTSLENAVEAITRAHNVPIGHPARPIRVGFGAFRP
jgi:RNA recognition motif-containing protein